MRILISNIFLLFFISLLFLFVNSDVSAYELNTGTYKLLDYNTDDKGKIEEVANGHLKLRRNNNGEYLLGIEIANIKSTNTCSFEGKCIRLGKAVKCFDESSEEVSVQYVQVDPMTVYIISNIPFGYCGHGTNVDGVYKMIK